MRWAQISVNASNNSIDAVTNVMVSNGSNGTSILDSGDDVVINCYLPVDDRLEERLNCIKSQTRMLPMFGFDIKSEDITVSWVEDDEWATAWKKYFKPLKVGRIVIKPSWEDYESAQDELIIEIDPGMAFGTGNHPTTQLCILALQDFVRPDDIVFDIGTGSGILAFSAAKLGASEVVGIDVDTVAVDAAVANIKLLKLENKVDIFRADSAKAIDGKADLVVANILANVIIDMSHDLISKLKPEGRLIVSGIIDTKADDVILALESRGMKLIEDRRQAEWVCLILSL